MTRVVSIRNRLTATTAKSAAKTPSAATSGSTLVTPRPSRTTSRRQAFTYERLAALVWAGLGGAFVPIALLPDWLEVLAWLTPTYWAMEGFRDVVLDGRGVTSVLPEVGALGVFAALFAVVAVSRFRMETARVNW